MTTLQIFDETGTAQSEPVSDHAAVSAALARLGVRFERWEADRPLAADADQEAVLEAYAAQVKRLVDEYGFRSMDVMSLRPEYAERAALREKFLQEHIHDDFEVRFFVDGSGLFYLHPGDRVYVVLCEQGDLITVPAGVPHWFDMGSRPDFKCIRLFTVPEGWVAGFTNSDMAERFPDFDRFVRESA